MKCRKVEQWEWQDKWSFTPGYRRVAHHSKPGVGEGREYEVCEVGGGEEFSLPIRSPEANISTLYIAPTGFRMETVEAPDGGVRYRCARL